MTEDIREQREADARCCDMRHQFLIERLQALQEATDDRFTAEEKAMHQRWAQLSIAMTKVENLATTRSDQQNEWRQTVNDITGTLVSRTEYNAAHQALIDKITNLSSRHDADLAIVREAIGVKTGRQLGQGQLIVWLFLGITAFISITGIALDLLIRH